MALHEHDDGRFTISSGGTWLDGIYETRKAANLAFRVSDAGLRSLWGKKAFHENGNADGTTDYALTHKDVLEVFRAERAAAKEAT